MAQDTMGRSDEQQMTLAEAYAQAADHLEGARYGEVASICGSILEAVPGHPDTHNLLGIMAQRQGRHAQAEAQFRQALQGAEEVAALHFNLGLSLGQLGRMASAIQAMERALELEPDSVPISQQLAAFREAWTGEGAVAVTSASPGSVEAQFEEGIRHHQQGQLEAAIQCYEQVLQQQPTYLDALNNLGAALVAAGRLEDALERFRQALAIQPHYPEVHNNIGVVERQRGALEAALASHQAAIEQRPEYAEGYQNLGLVQRDMGAYEAALASHRQASALKPGYADAHIGIGSVLRDMGRREEAETSYRTALRLHPEHAEGYNHLGALLREQGHLEEALTQLDQALRLQPDMIEALDNRALALFDLGRMEEARGVLEKALLQQPDRYDVVAHLGVVLRELGERRKAMDVMRHVLILKPDYAPAHSHMGLFLADEGRTEEALQSYRQALALAPDAALRFKIALTQLPIHRSQAEIDQLREGVMAQLAAICRGAERLDDPCQLVGQTSFLFAYHAHNDRLLQEKIAEAYLTVTPSLAWRSPHLDRHRPSGGRLKLGIFSAYLHDNHTIGHLNEGLIRGLGRDRFEVVLFRPQAGAGKPTDKLDGWADRVVTVPGRLARAREVIAEQALDILYYPDIGMDPLSYFCAFARLAPVQCLTWGHPVTTGIPNMDLFISSSLMEGPGAESHYSERLHLLSRMPTCIARPEAPLGSKGRAHFKLPESGRLYLCPQALFKLHPDFDAALKGILQADPQGWVVFIDGSHRHWSDLLKERLQGALGTLSERVHFTPRMGGNDFLRLLSLADVILDPFHFSGGKTSYEALAFGAPIVTRPGETMRARVTLGYYRLMGMEDLVAADLDGYVELATRLGMEPEFRQAMVDKIEALAPKLFDDREAVREMGACFEGAFEAYRAGLAS
ncbi:MAG: tetratricopeptide repeat protein [Magnetococcales bacterium]|nr:tetratricopeptide repeat protein [Magnetococcales bacterium]